eukprot:COSAG04_NODE_2487_length_4025_cov_1.246307_4_plen_138_part_00
MAGLTALVSEYGRVGILREGHHAVRLHDTAALDVGCLGPLYLPHQRPSRPEALEVIDDRQTHVVALVDPAAVHCSAQHSSSGKLSGRAESWGWDVVEGVAPSRAWEKRTSPMLPQNSTGVISVLARASSSEYWALGT